MLQMLLEEFWANIDIVMPEYSRSVQDFIITRLQAQFPTVLANSVITIDQDGHIHGYSSPDNGNHTDSVFKMVQLTGIIISAIDWAQRQLRHTAANSQAKLHQHFRNRTGISTISTHQRSRKTQKVVVQFHQEMTEIASYVEQLLLDLSRELVEDVIQHLKRNLQEPQE